MKLRSFNSLSLTLLVPLVLCGVVMFALMTFVTYVESKSTSEGHVKQQAIEFSESFLMATEVNSSRSSIVRTANSLGTYKGVREIFIVDALSEKVIASNKNKFVGAGISMLPSHYLDSGVEKVFREGEKLFARADQDNYVFAYRANVLSEDKKSTSAIVILMLLTSEGISGFLQDFRNWMMIYSALAFVGALVMFYLILKLTLLRRIDKIVNVIKQVSPDDKLRLCPVEIEDELGILVMAYNQSLLSDYENKAELIRANENLSRLSHFDSLTGMSNRRNFDRVLNEEWKRGARYQLPMALMMIDVDNFKLLNDFYGHIVGDNCLKAVAVALDKTLKRPGDLLSRFGGDEFSILLPNTAEGASVVAEACLKEIEKLCVDVGPDVPTVYLTISVGVAYAVPLADMLPNSLLELADQALYKAKQDGRNRVVMLGAELTGPSYNAKVSSASTE